MASYQEVGRLSEWVPFEEGVEGARSVVRERLLLDLDGYAGPIDVLLELARDQKVDLKHIRILDLAEQYLEFVREARELRLELAADRSEEHTSELQSLMRISYAVFCLKKKKKYHKS